MDKVKPMRESAKVITYESLLKSDNKAIQMKGRRLWNNITKIEVEKKLNSN